MRTSKSPSPIYTDNTAAPTPRTLLPTGPAYLSHLRLTLHHHNSFSSHDAHLSTERDRLDALNASTSLNGEDDLGVGDEPETDELLALDPKEWKVPNIFSLSLARVLICIQKQDHYAVLGLSHLRYTATLAQIKIARASDPSQGRPYIITYLLSPDRKKVLKHHPDKKAGSTSTSVQSLLTGINTNDDAFFKCIQKAHEVLTNPEKRRQFDSVDPAFLEVEDDVPTAASFKVCFVV